LIAIIGGAIILLFFHLIVTNFGDSRMAKINDTQPDENVKTEKNSALFINTVSLIFYKSA